MGQVLQYRQDSSNWEAGRYRLRGKDESMAGQLERLGVLEEKMDRVEEGVSNFRKHSERAVKFFDTAEALWADQERRRKRNWQIVGLLALFLVPLSGWGCAKIVQAGVTIFQIEQEWKAAHPSEFKQKSLFVVPDGVYAKNQQPQQDAGDTMMPNH